MIALIRQEEAKAQVTTRQGEGLSALLDFAQAAAREKQMTAEADELFQIVYMINWSLTRLSASGIDYTEHLRQMQQGNFRFGQQDSKESRFKGFEFEMFVAASLTEFHADVELYPPGSNFDIRFGRVMVECKQPDSPDPITIQGYVSDFNAKLHSLNTEERIVTGVIAIGIEDMFDSRQLPIETLERMDDRSSPMHKQLDAYLTEVFVPYICSQKYVLGAFVSFTLPFENAGHRVLCRLVNGLAVDRPTKFQNKMAKAEFSETTDVLSKLPSCHPVSTVEISERWFKSHPEVKPPTKK